MSTQHHIPNPPPGFDTLSVEQQIDYVQSLWDHIAENSAAIPLTSEQREELERRVRELDENPSIALTWDEVLIRVRE